MGWCFDRVIEKAGVKQCDAGQHVEVGFIWDEDEYILANIIACVDDRANHLVRLPVKIIVHHRIYVRYPQLDIEVREENGDVTGKCDEETHRDVALSGDKGRDTQQCHADQRVDIMDSDECGAVPRRADDRQS